MPRKPRIVSENGIYHVVSRGVNNESIFLKDSDYINFLKILKVESKEKEILIFSYCLMKNHYHLLIKLKKANLSNFFQSLNSKYASYFNFKYFRRGHLFQNRFKSYFINNLSYLLNVSRYIHLNPVFINIVERPEDFKWSSYKHYFNNINNNLVNIDEFYQLTNFNKDKYISFVNEYKELNFNFVLEKGEDKVDIKETLKILKERFNLNFSENTTLRDLLIYFFVNKNIKLQKIEEVFNLSRSQIYRIFKKISFELEKNIEILKLYDNLLLKMPIFEE